MVGERIEEGFAALTLESEALGGIEAIFVPEAGMICCGLRHRGEELLGQRGGLTKYVETGLTMGAPFLHPWANRLEVSRFELAGREVDLELNRRGGSQTSNRVRHRTGARCSRSRYSIKVPTPISIGPGVVTSNPSQGGVIRSRLRA